MKPRRSAKPKSVGAPRENQFQQLDAEMALAKKVSSVAEIFKGETTIEMRRERMREAIGSRGELFSEFRRVYRE